MSNNPKLDEYIKNTRAQGFTDEQIKNKLIESGYTQNDIDNIFQTIENISSNKVEQILQNKVTENSNSQTFNSNIKKDNSSDGEQIKLHIPIEQSSINPTLDQTSVTSDVLSYTLSQEDPNTTEDASTNIAIQSSLYKGSPVPSGIIQPIRSTAIQNQNIMSVNQTSSMLDSSTKSDEIINTQSAHTQSNQAGEQIVIMPVKRSSFLKAALIILCITLLAGAGAYAYVNDMIPFIQKTPYSEEGFVSGIFQKMATIESANYVFFTKAYMDERNPNLQSFPEIKNLEEIQATFERDIERISLLNTISALKRYDTKSFLYPDSLTTLQTLEFKENYSIDEEIFKEIIPTYKSINSGKGYELKITLETQEAIKLFKEDLDNELEFEKKYSSIPKKISAQIDGNTITVNNPNGESMYVSIGYDFPKSATQELFGMVSKLPPEFVFDAQLDVKGREAASSTDLALNISVEGDMSDLTYKFSADVIKEQKDFFVKLNNFPGIILDFLPIQKGEWILFSEKEIANQVGYSEDISEEANNLDIYKKRTTELFVESLKIAEEQKIIRFVDKPTKETLDIGKTYKYSIKIDETKAISYIIELINFIKTNNDFELTESDIKDLDAFLITVQDPQFGKEIQYIFANSMYTVWVDLNGYPVKMESKTTILPSDKNKALSNKQFVLEFGFSMKNINQPVEIIRPSEYKTIEEVMSSMFSF